MFVWFSLEGYGNAFGASLLVSLIAIIVMLPVSYGLYRILKGVGLLNAKSKLPLDRKRQLTFNSICVVVIFSLVFYIWWQNFSYAGKAIEHGSAGYLSKTDIVVADDHANSYRLINKVGNKPVRFYTVDKEDKNHVAISYIDVAPGEVENNRNIDKSVNIPSIKAGDIESKYEGNGLINDGFAGTKIIHIESPKAPGTKLSDYDEWFVINHSDQKVDIIDNDRPLYKGSLQPVDPHRMIVQ